MTRTLKARSIPPRLATAALCALVIHACASATAGHRPIPPEQSQPRYFSYRPIFGILPEKPPRGLYPAGYAGGNVLAEPSAVLVEPSAPLPPPAFNE